MNAIWGRIERLRSSERDRGFSLVELIVAMGIFTIFISLFLAAVVGLAKGTTQVKLTAESASSTLIVFQNLDRQVRYADSINFPGSTANGRYIEFRIPAESAIDGVTTCIQWRYVAADGTIESRQWPDVVGSTKTPWAAKLTTAIDVAGADYPFKLVPATSTGTAKQQLVLRVESGNADLKAGAAIKTTFVARNSSLTSPSNSDTGGNLISTTPVCLASGTRP